MCQNDINILSPVGILISVMKKYKNVPPNVTENSWFLLQMSTNILKQSKREQTEKDNIQKVQKLAADKTKM